jgi:poly-gamma-glutamate synthesis protein (capsule biosynthesis protein)
MKEQDTITKKLRGRKLQKREKWILTASITGVLLLAAGTTAYILPAHRRDAASQSASFQEESASSTEGSILPTRLVDAEITVSLMGDCTLGTDENFSYDTSLNAYYASQGPDYFFQNVRSILEADDLSIINMEGPLTTSTTRGSDQFDFKGDPSFVDILTDSSIEAANVANNHSHDYGDQGFTDTKETLENAGIAAFGYDDTSIVTVKGVNVGLVGIYELYDHLERTQQLKDNIAKVKADGADVVIVVFHWGNEKETVPDSNQTTLAHTAIDYGADLVVGHHPHVLQGIEEYHGKYIAYSLGNFCFGGNSNPSDTDTIIFQQTFTLKNGEVLTDDNINIIPCSISSVSGYNNYQPTPAQDSEADRILEKLKERSEAIGSYLTFW